MKRLMNFRYFFVLAISMICCDVLLTTVFMSEKLKIIFISLLLAITILISILVFTLKTRLLYVLMSILLICCLMSGNLLIRQKTLNKYLEFENENIVVYGRICSDFSFVGESYIRFNMDDIKFISGDKSENVFGKIYVYSNAYKVDLTKLERGRYISFIANVDIFELTKNEQSYLSSNIVAKVNNIDTDITILDKTHLNLKEKIKDCIYNKLESSNIKYSGIAYAMIFGDSNFISGDIQTIFREGGISHLLAVSGLNISILIFIILFIMKKIRINPKVSFSISIIMITIYSYFCDFTPSVVRASLMAIIKMITDINHKPYDGLSSLSFSASSILLINPLLLYNYSFILSYFAVFVIILFQFSLQKLLSKYFVDRFSSGLSLNLSVAFGLSVIQLYLFSYVPVLSIIVNMVSVPIVLYSFIYLLVVLLIMFIFPFMSGLLKLFDFMISIVIKFSAWINKFGLMIYYNNLEIALLIIFIFFIFNISQFVFQKREVKLKQSILMIILALIIQTKIIF